MQFLLATFGFAIALNGVASSALFRPDAPEEDPAHTHGPIPHNTPAPTVPDVHMCTADDTANWNIYCSGPILEAVNHHALFNDSKTFVDMPLKQSPADTLDAYNRTFGNVTFENIDAAKLTTFVNTHFSPPGSELFNCTPMDWQEFPAKLKNIKDATLRAWAFELNGIWKNLCKKVRPEIDQHPDLYSLIYVPHEFIVPGGRFREFYYWDNYWIIKGLMASEMYDTAAQMIRNLAYMVNRFGFVPNGGRVYYLKRSQPPLLTPMVYEFFEATHNTTFLREMLPTLQKELSFWDAQRLINVTVGGETFGVYQYKSASNVPRPESFKEDIGHAQGMNDVQKRFFYQNLASAAESGWDFSTRWFKDRLTLETLEITKILPVDLNSFMCWNLDILEYLFEQIDDTDTAENYRDRRAHFREMVEKVFYNDSTGAYHDYNMRMGAQNVEFYPSVALPLFTSCYNDLNQHRSQRIYDFMQNSGAFNYPGGVPTSRMNNSGEQWDFPNGWSPLNHVIIEGLRKSENPRMQDQAFRIASKWVNGNYEVFRKTNVMYEKYNVANPIPKAGAGGEYDVQEGFGWSNGVILDLLVTYADRIQYEGTIDDVPRTTRQATTPTSKSAVTHRSSHFVFVTLFVAIASLFVQ